MSEIGRLSNRNRAIQEMMTDGERVKDFYRFAAQNPHISLHDACQIVLVRPKASVCFSFEEWHDMGRRISKGRKGIQYYDSDGNKSFVFDAVDTYGETRFKREIFPMKCLLEGLDELNGTDLINSNRRDYQKVLSGVTQYLQQSEDFTDDEQYNRVLAEGISYLLYSTTGYPKENGIRLHAYPYSLKENAALFCRVRELSQSVREDIEDAYLRRKQRVPVIEDIDEEYVTDEPFFTGESQDETVTVKINAAVISQYEGYDVLWQHEDSSSDPSAGSLYLGKRENYDKRGNYDNTDNSLIFVTHNDKLFRLLEGSTYTMSQKMMVEEGGFSDDDYREYHDVCENLKGQLQQIRTTRFGADVSKGTNGYPFRYPDYNGTPLYIRYMSVQDEYPDAIVLTRLGDFYEIFGEKAKEAADKLNLTLTGRDCGLGDRVPMCGFPYHVTEMYVNKLLEQSAVVVLEDGEEPKYIASEQEVNGDEGNDEAAELDEEVEEVVPQEEKPSEKGIKDRKRKSKPQMSLFDFMEDDELTKKEKLITQTLQRGSGVENGKQRIFDKYQQNPTKQEFASFLSKEYGIGGWSGPDIEDHMHDGKGIRVISSDKTISVFMKWPEVAERIADLIDDNNYFREGENSQTNSESEAAPATEENHTDVNEYSLAEQIEEQKEENTDLDAIGLDQSEFGGAKQRFKNNVKAIRLVKKLYREEKAPTESEKKTLAKYVGWGGLPQAFDENNESWQREYKELKDLLSQDEYDTAKGSVLNAHFTSKEVITGIYAALQRFGVRGNNKILEPAVGTGNFFGFMPKEISENARLYGVELDEITGKIATKLYPNANIQIKGFEQTTFSDNQFDIMVSNVPFGNYSVYDSAYARYSFQIHDYFIAKGIDKIKPGGIMAVITSKGTMDKQSASVRKYIADRAELIGAIRLPNTAFKQTAGTEVTSDILFFRKCDEKINATPENTEWLTVGKNEQGLELNSYYISHPEMICGELAEEVGLYGLKDLTVKPDGREIGQALSNAVSHLPENIYENPEYTAESAEEHLEADYDIRPMCYKADKGKLYLRIGDEMVEQAIPSSPKDAYARIEAMIRLRNDVRHILNIQLEGCSDSALELAQHGLNKEYDSFVKKYGYLNGSTNSRLFKDDADSALLFTIETLSEDKKSAKKSDIFTKRTIRPYSVPTQTDDCFEALQITRNEKGSVDIAFIEELTKKDYNTVLVELGNAVFRNPIAVDPEDKYSGFETQEEYLSGNVVKKLQQARHFVNMGFTEYETNVKALESVQPTPLKASEISVKLGASWVDVGIYKQCLWEMLGLPYWAQDGVEIFYNKHDGSWKVDKEGYAARSRYMETYQVYGTERANAFRLFEDCMNQKATQIYDTVEDSDGRTKRVLNQAETIAAREKQNKIQEYFKNWIYSDPERREALEAKYNSIFNQTRVPVYDGSYLKFPEMNAAITLRPHQKNAVHRIVSTGSNTLLHHVVGSGKTMTMIAAGMKLKQYGLAKKPMYVVPNHLVQQWADEFRKTYPNANVLITQKDDLDKDKRKRFVSKVAMGDWDGIIISQSTFARIGISPERQIKKLREEIAAIEESITTQWDESNVPRGAVKNLERIKKGREAQLKKLLDDTKKDSVLIFEDLGVDYLFVDESDAYKNLFLYTKMNNVAGISNAASQRASDMQMKIEYINELHGGDKGVVFATGTPISNSMAEMYTLQTYLQKHALQEMGINYFDAWAADFGETVTSLELAPSGQGYRAKTRFAKFTNLPELLTLYRVFADVQTSDMVKLDVPEADRNVITIKPSDEVIELTGEIADRAERIYGGGVDPHIDNMLKVTSDGKKIALDPRCYDPTMPDADVSKLNQCAEEIVRFYHESEDMKGTQLVFCDLSTPKKAFEDYEYGKDFDAYNDLKYKLVARGIPAEEIAYIHEANSDFQKQTLFNKVNEGTVRVLIGSTEKCGAGTNVQKRLVAIHHLDAPYRPRDFIQRDGRGIRQGNINKTVHINTYVRERTFDSYSYQILENKQRFISQIEKGDVTVREADDIDETTLTYAEIKAITSANPKIKRKMELDNELQNLRLLESRYRKNIYDLQDKIRKTYPEQIQKQKLYIERLRKDIAMAKENYNPDAFSINVGGKVYTDKKEGGQALLDALQACKTDVTLAEYCGFKISLDPMVMLTAERTLTVAGAGQYQVTASQAAHWNISRLESMMQEFPERETRALQKLEQLESDMAAAKREVEVPFEHTERIAEITKELAEINAELDLNKREEVVIDDTDEETGEAYMALPTHEEEMPVRKKARARLSKSIERLYSSEQKKSPESYIFVDDKGMYCAIGVKAEEISELTGVELQTGMLSGEENKWVALTDDEFDKVTRTLMDQGVTVKVIMQDKKQKEETFIDKTDFMERMEVALYPDYRIDQDDMNAYGYQWNGMLPMGKGYAREYLDMGLPIYFLESNDTETEMHSAEEVDGKSGLFGIEKDVWHTFITHQDTYPYIVARSMIMQSMMTTLNKDMDYMDGMYIDGLTDSYFDEERALKRYVAQNGIGNINKAKQFIPRLMDEVTKTMSVIPFEHYGWDISDVQRAIANHIENVELSQVATEYVEKQKEREKEEARMGEDKNDHSIEIDTGYGSKEKLEATVELYEVKSPLTGKEGVGLAVQLWNYGDYDGEKLLEPYAMLTTNFGEPISIKNSAYVDLNNNPFATQLLDMGIATDTGFTKQSGYVTYPLWRFDEKFLEEIGGENYKRYSDEWDEMFRSQDEIEDVLDDMSVEEAEELLNVEPVDYRAAVFDSVEQEFDEFRDDMLSQPQVNIFHNSYKIHIYSNLKDVFDEDSYLSDQDYKTLYDDRGSILSLLYNEIVGDEFINVDSYSELGDGIKQYCRNREEEKQAEIEALKKAALNDAAINRECKQDIQSAIRENFDGMHLKEGFEERLIQKYGEERINYLLANTVQYNMEDGRYSPVNKEWASSIVVESSDDEKRRWILETHPAVLDGVISRMLRRAKEKTEVKEVPDRQEERETRKWLTAKVPHEAVIQTNENRSFMRMPLDGQYAGYTYNMFNNRIKQSTRITDIQSDSRETCLELVVAEDDEIWLRKDGETVILTGKDFVEEVDDTYAESYERKHDESAWTRIAVPNDAMRGIYEQSTLFSMPTNGEYNGYSYYLPNVFVEEDRTSEDGKIQISLPNDFKVTIRNRESGNTAEFNPQEFAAIVDGTTNEDYALRRGERSTVKEQETVSDENGWHYVSVSQEARLGKYEKASLFRMPQGEYESYLYYLPNAFLRDNDEKGTVRVGIPDDLKVTIKDKTNDEEITLTAEEFTDLVKGKTDEDYKSPDDSFHSPKREGKFNAEAEERLRANVPDEMKNRPNWVAVRTRYREDTGRVEKYLINPKTGKFAESDNPETWTSFDEACKYARENGGDTLAYALDGKDNIFCIDVDHCYENGAVVSDLVRDIEESGVHTYCERSVSGTGLHYFGKTKGLDVRAFSKDGEMEFYQKSHFIAMTGDMRSSGNELESIDGTELQSLIEEKCDRRTGWKGIGTGVEGLSNMSDREVTERALRSADKDFEKLYGGQDLFSDHSRSDMALMSRLAFWCNGDKEQMLRVFATSGLYRPEKSPDYYEGTAIKCIQGNTNRYTPRKEQPATPPKKAVGFGKA